MNHHNNIVDDQTTIKLFTAPYFLATKLEAFKARGKNSDGQYDGRVSPDFEDIVFLLVNRRNIWTEIAETNEILKEYLKEEFTLLLENPYFEEWIDAHTGYTSPAAQAIVLPQVRRFIQKK